MPVDFKSLSSSHGDERVVEPRKIFSALPAKPFSYLRDVQGTVLASWFDRRQSRDLLIKMNTGSGKTVVGMLALQSSINEGVGPALYVAADNYLAEQARTEARNLGIAVVDDPRSPAYAAGSAIAVVNVWRVFNGNSIFGVNQKRLDIGTVLVDDVHACLATARDQFTLTIPRTHELYEKLFGLFKSGLSDQSRATLLELEDGEPGAVARVPFWTWAEKLEHVTDAIHEHRNDDEVKWAWPLIHDHLAVSSCAVSSAAIEIQPPCLPVEVIPSFEEAGRRIYLTATLNDAGVLVSDFGADPESVRLPITPETSSDIGERMILLPQELNPRLEDDGIAAWIRQLADRWNVVVIVPSDRRARFWEPIADLVLSGGTLEEGISSLRESHVGLAVMVNRYDGVDLPESACRVLILDGLPEAVSATDRIEAAGLSESDALLTRQIQRIDQGMGRAVRSNEDHCVVILLGSRLVQRVHHPSGRDRFSPATRVQLDLSHQVALQLAGAEIEDLDEVVGQCLGRDDDWIAASRRALIDAESDAAPEGLGLHLARREAFEHWSNGQYRPASLAVQNAIDAVDDPKHKGWLLQEKALYTHFFDPVQAQEVLLAARRLNPRVAKPLEGVSYRRITIPPQDQAFLAKQYLVERYASANDLLVGLNALVDELGFPSDAEAFESALAALAEPLGFTAQRPDHDFGTGPDVMWAVGGSTYFLFECKSDATSNEISKRYVDQLSGHVNWFRDAYDPSATAVPIMAHPSNVLSTLASPPLEARLLAQADLQRMRESVKGFARMVADANKWHDAQAVKAALQHFGLLSSSFIERQTQRLQH